MLKKSRGIVIQKRKHLDEMISDQKSESFDRGKGPRADMMYERMDMREHGR